ncbi:MAG: hypothetical protein ACK56I_15170, partial [bacterium]
MIAVPDVECAWEGVGTVDGAGIGPEAINHVETVTGIAGDQELAALAEGWDGEGTAAETDGWCSG